MSHPDLSKSNVPNAIVAVTCRSQYLQSTQINILVETGRMGIEKQKTCYFGKPKQMPGGQYSQAKLALEYQATVVLWVFIKKVF